MAFYGCLSARADAFFELTDVLLCADGPTRTPVELSLLAGHQRGYGSLYGALNHGWLDVDALRDLLASLSMPRFGARTARRETPAAPWSTPLPPSRLLWCRLAWPTRSPECCGAPCIRGPSTRTRGPRSRPRSGARPSTG
ncbi:transposase [Streptomyces rimosus]|uniref:transposase n=1 Tax=Streptomyces rimosus TaxID=1927 RepID=UPI0037978C9B